MNPSRRTEASNSRKCSPAALLILLATVVSAALYAQTAAPQTQTPSILEYVKQTWTVLTRSDKDLAKAAIDPKFRPDPDGRWPVYVPRSDDLQLVEEGLRREMPAAGFKSIDIRQLPEDLDSLREQGLLYLPRPYVVPGGRFNEMYGWDSFFIQVGLLRDGELNLAKDMADNFLYEVKNYGKVLNANRTYYLTRSQPPFLTQMVLGVYKKTQDRKWLEDAEPEIEKYYRRLGNRPAPDTGNGLVALLRYGRRSCPGSGFSGARCARQNPLRASERVLQNPSDYRLRHERVLRPRDRPAHAAFL